MMSDIKMPLPSNLLIVMAKAPMPGQVKTRLSPRIPPDKATELYRCLLQDRISQMAELDEPELAIAYTPESAAAYFKARKPDRFRLFAQKGKTLSDRLTRLFSDRFAEGYTAVSVIDSDTPDLESSIMNQSFRLLASHDAVYGPSHDGGFYLVGLRNPHPAIFEEIPWSTPDVLQASLMNAEKLGLKTALLPERRDIDTYDDLVDFYMRYKDRNTKERGPGKHTFRYLKQHLDFM